MSKIANYPFTTLTPNIGMVPLSEPAAEFLKRLRRKSGDHASDTTDEADGAAAEIYRPDQVCIADIPGLVEGAHLNIGLGVRKTHAEFCIKNYAFYIKNDEFYIKNDAFCIKNDAFCRSLTLRRSPARGPVFCYKMKILD